MNLFKRCGWMMIMPLLAAAFAVQADNNRKTIDEYQIHYSAFNSSFLEPQVAEAYGIQRSKSRALMNISVLKKQGDGTVPVTAMVSGTMENIIGQRQTLTFTQVDEGDAIYYLTSFPISNDELLRFNLKVQPDPNESAYELKFQQKFYTD